MGSSKELHPCGNPNCGRPMGMDYLCIGCKKPVHWFCAVGNTFVNEGEGHGAHYWCSPCHAWKFAKKTGVVLESSWLKAQGKATTNNGNTVSKKVAQATRSPPFGQQMEATTSNSPVHSKMHVVVGDDVFTFSDTLMEQAALLKSIGKKRKHKITVDVHTFISDTPRKQREHP
jgi:hypothetical protein